MIDPAKVVRTALQDAASVAGLLITTEGHGIDLGTYFVEFPNRLTGDPARVDHFYLSYSAIRSLTDIEHLSHMSDSIVEEYEEFAEES